MTEKNMKRFRAWDLELNVYIPCFYITENGILLKYDSICIDNYPKHILIQFNATLEQWTGLTDKNGVDYIYENDIIDENGLLKGNAHEQKAEKTDLIISSITEKTWQATIKEGLERGLRHA